MHSSPDMGVWGICKLSIILFEYFVVRQDCNLFEGEKSNIMYQSPHVFQMLSSCRQFMNPKYVF